ncbi:MAG: hypothetical protein K6F92_04955 [Lachnospiraceae bacterium]|nr:hypothetical protein [Lachnospiraceae bacterium]
MANNFRVNEYMTIMVTPENLWNVSSEEFMGGLADRGCREVTYVLFGGKMSAFEMNYLNDQIELLNNDYKGRVSITLQGEREEAV